MNPQQYPGAQTPAPAPEQNPYDFILNHGNQPQPQGKFNLPAGKSQLQRVLIFAGGLLLLLIVGLVFMSVLTGGSNNSDKLLTIAQEQTELIRIAGLADNERAVRSTSTQNLATNINLSLGTSKTEVLTLIDSKKVAKQLTLKKSTATDAKLTSAAENNQYDAVFTETIDTQLTAYQAHVKELYTSSKSAEEKKILERAYNGATLLLTQK